MYGKSLRAFFEKCIGEILKEVFRNLQRISWKIPEIILRNDLEICWVNFWRYRGNLHEMFEKPMCSNFWTLLMHCGHLWTILPESRILLLTLLIHFGKGFFKTYWSPGLKWFLLKIFTKFGREKLLKAMFFSHI